MPSRAKRLIKGVPERRLKISKKDAKKQGIIIFFSYL